jgi:competence protein ComEA
MLKLSRLPLAILAVTIATPVLAADPSATVPPPSSATTMPAKPSTGSVTQTSAPKAATVDINNASATDLKTLPGMTDAEAGKIVQGRPYKDPSDLTTKKILTDAEFAKIKDHVVAGAVRS